MTEYRTPTAADGPALDTMARQIWVETFGHSAPAADIAAYLAEAYGPAGKLLRDLADPAIIWRIAVAGGHIVGYAKLVEPWLPPEDIAPGGLQLSQLYVASAHHGSGIADALMRWTIDTARTRGANALYLTVWEENVRAQRFYQRRGFVQIGEFAFPTGSQIDRDLIMRLIL